MRALTWLGLYLGTLLVPSALSAEPACRRASADHLLWAHTGEWKGQRLVLGDTGAGALAVLNLPDLQWSRVSYPGEGPLEFNKPLIFPGLENGVLVSATKRLVWLDETLRPIRGLALEKAVTESQEVGLFGAVVSQRLEMLGAAFVMSSRGEPWSGLATLELEPTLQVKRIRPLANDSNEFKIYTLIFSFGALQRDRLFWLAMNPDPFVLEVSGGVGQRLDLVPLAWRSVPRIPARGFDTMREDWAAIEKLSFPAGLYSQGSELFILYHGSDKTGTRWSLAAVDPEKAGTHRLLTLPTRSNWVTVVPGPEYWAILEQGPVLGPSMQTTKSVLLVPSAWFSAPDSPLTKPGAETACAEKP